MLKFYIQLIFSLLLPDSFLVKLLLKKVMKRYKLTKLLLKTALTYVLCTNAAFEFKVGLSLPTQNRDSSYQDGIELEEKLKQSGFDADVFFAGDNSSKLQLKQVQRMVDENYNLIVISPINGKDYKKVLEDTHAKNITLVSYDKMLQNTKNVDYFVKVNNTDIGVLQAQFLIERLELQTLGAKRILSFLQATVVITVQKISGKA